VTSVHRYEQCKEVLHVWRKFSRAPKNGKIWHRSHFTLCTALARCGIAELRWIRGEQVPTCLGITEQLGLNGFQFRTFIITYILGSNIVLEYQCVIAVIPYNNRIYVTKLHVHGSVHHNINLIEITNKMRPSSRIYYYNVS
jgi:hypothetical protein